MRTLTLNKSDYDDIFNFHYKVLTWKLSSHITSVSTVEVVQSLEVVQYIGGITSALCGDSFSTVEVVQYSAGDNISTCVEIR